MEITIKDWKHLFPFNEPRDPQIQAINFILNSFNSGKKFVISELGTGIGKSAIGITVSRYLDQVSKLGSYSYILTTQKVLQEQYVNDFGTSKNELLKSIKSATNYTCNFYQDQSCGESRRLLNSLKGQINGSNFFNSCTKNCAYVSEKKSFLNSKIGITNFSYFLAETMYAKKLEPRELLIIDECHNIESELSKFIEVVFSEKFAKETLKCKLPKLYGDQDNQLKIAFKWVKEDYLVKLKRHFSTIQSKISKVISDVVDPDDSEFNILSKRYELIDKHICKVNRFIDNFDENNWILNVIDSKFDKRSLKKLEFKPVDVSTYADSLLYHFGTNVLMMSATIVDKDVFCNTIGINLDDVAFLSMPSPFDIKNRPVHILPAGKMSMNNIDATLPKLSEVVTMLLELHKNDKGIIHCTNYKIAKYIHENVKNDRLLIHNSENRDITLINHMQSKSPTVLLSPSMMEGVDLSGDASRFQILCKVPFPYLGDKVIKKRKLLNPKWYIFQTVKSIIQAMGRSVRSDTDHATSYVLDEDWNMFFNINKNLFPKDFRDSIIK